MNRPDPFLPPHVVTPAAHAQRGMNLIEIMVVLVIISLITGTIGVAVFNQLKSARNQTAATQIKQFEDALELYKLQKKRYPSTAEGLTVLKGTPGSVSEFMKDIPNDPWDRPYVYIQPGTRNPSSFDIMTYGEDGVESADDVGNWKQATN